MKFLFPSDNSSSVCIVKAICHKCNNCSVECSFRYLGFKQTILLDRRLLVDLIDQYNSGFLSWNEFSDAVKESHESRKGQPTQRLVIPDRPKEEDYFYANPEECLQPSYGQLSST